MGLSRVSNGPGKDPGERMRVHFTAVGENSTSYINQLKLLLFSFRRNAGPYRDAPFTVIINGSAPDPNEKRQIEQRFDARVRVMPRIAFYCPQANKFNYLYAVDEEYDILVNFDCDTVVLRPIDGILSGLEPGELCFSGTAASDYLVWNTRALLRRYANITPQEAISVYGDKLQFFKPRSPKRMGGFRRAPFPYFTGGCYAMSGETVETIREDIVRIAHELSIYGRFCFRHQLVFRVNRLLVRCFRNTPFTIGPHYKRVYSEPLALSLAILRHRVPINILDDRYNQYHLTEPEEGPACILHYTTRAYPLPREELLTRRWVDAYSNATHRPEAPQLAALIEDYINTYQS